MDDEQEKSSEPEKRIKRSNGYRRVERSFHDSAYLKKFIIQRQLVSSTQKTRYLKSLRKVGTMNLSEIGK